MASSISRLVFAPLATLASISIMGGLALPPIVSNLFEAVDVAAMIKDGRVSSLYKVQKALEEHVSIFDVYYFAGRSKALSILLVEEIIRGVLPVKQYGEDVLNILRYLKESGVGLQRVTLHYDDDLHEIH